MCDNISDKAVLRVVKNLMLNVVVIMMKVHNTTLNTFRVNSILAHRYLSIQEQRSTNSLPTQHSTRSNHTAYHCLSHHTCDTKLIVLILALRIKPHAS